MAGQEEVPREGKTHHPAQRRCGLRRIEDSQHRLSLHPLQDDPIAGALTARGLHLNASDPDAQNVTALLRDTQQGVAGAADRLASLVYAELHRIAESAMRGERAGHTLQPTLLVDEAFLRLVGRYESPWRNRAQFFALAAQTIRRILVDHARARRRLKRDHGLRVTLNEAVAEAPERSLDLLALDDALTQLEALAPRQARVVEMRYFVGLEVEETAEALDISVATVKRDWTFARAFLLRTLAEQM